MTDLLEPPDLADPGTAEIDFLSYSSLSTHRRCPQQWSYKYLRGISPIDVEVTVDRDLGSWWHAIRAVDSIRRGHRSGSLRRIPPKITTTDGGPVFKLPEISAPLEQFPHVPDVIDAFTTWLNRQSADARDAWTERCNGDPTDHLRGMGKRWFRRWEHDLAQEAPVAVELKWRRVLPSTEATIGGYIDEVFLDLRRNLVVVRDHKSQKTLTLSAEDDLMESQLFLYAWGATPTIKDLTDGRGPTAIAYDRIRTAAPKTPSLTASGGLSKSVTDYDLDTYLAWSRGIDGEGIPWGSEGEFFKSGKRKGEPKFGRYVAEQEVIDRLSTPQAQALWATRTLSPMNVNVVRSHLRAALDTHRQSEQTRARYEQSGEAPRSFGASCRFCDFADLCRAEMIGGPGADYDLEELGLEIRAKRGRR